MSALSNEYLFGDMNIWFGTLHLCTRSHPRAVSCSCTMIAQDNHQTLPLQFSWKTFLTPHYTKL